MSRVPNVNLLPASIASAQRILRLSELAFIAQPQALEPVHAAARRMCRIVEDCKRYPEHQLIRQARGLARTLKRTGVVCDVLERTLAACVANAQMRLECGE